MPCVKKLGLSCFFLLLSHSLNLVHLCRIFLCTVNLCYVCSTCYTLCLLSLLMDSISWLRESHFRVTSIKKCCWFVSEFVTSLLPMIVFFYTLPVKKFLAYMHSLVRRVCHMTLSCTMSYYLTSSCSICNISVIRILRLSFHL